MNKKEIFKLLTAVKFSYPRFYTNFTNDDFNMMSASWMSVLDGCTYEQASAGLAMYMKNDNGFPPTPGQVFQCIVRMSESQTIDIPTAQEAWDRVYDAICGSAYLFAAEEEFNNLPDILKRCVGGARSLQAMALMNPSDLNTVEKSHFIKTYKELCDKVIESRKQNEIMVSATKEIEQNG